MVYAIFCLGLLGVIASFGLGVASKVFAVETDPKIEEVNEALPQANCGGCGFAGCINFAEAVVKGEAEPNGCVAADEATIVNVAKILGKTVSIGVRKVAFVKCKGSKDIVVKKFEYNGFNDCRGAQIIGGGYKGCSYGCFGLGTCEKVCPFDAIKIDESGLPVVDETKCTGCGNCVKVCPRNLIELVPVNKKVRILCSSKETGAKVKKVCSVGCISCGKCERVCPVNAIKVVDNIAVIDFDKCINCGLCSKNCPVGVIVDFNDKDKPKSMIDKDKCIGCGKCKKVCPVNAISGNLKEVHVVNREKCLGCGLCKQNCPKEAITLQ